MRKLAYFALIALVVVGLQATDAGAAKDKGKGKVKLPKLTGGGVTRNYNSGTYGEYKLLTYGGFTAQATGEGTPGLFVAPFADHPITTYPAKGEVDLHFVPEEGPASAGAVVHGKVVCIANLGPSGEIDGDDAHDDEVADPALDVWEIRFEITTSSGYPFPQYGSIFVQDGGKSDFADESFSAAVGDDPSCGLIPFFGLEPQLKGNIRVK